MNHFLPAHRLPGMLSFALSLFLCAALGCKAPERTSLHESDHEQPSHWPHSLADAADKLTVRFNELTTAESTNSDRSVAFAELREILGWTPEVAADSRLTEAEWLPIYESSETLLATLASTASLEESNASQSIISLCLQLRQADIVAQSRAPKVDEPTEDDDTAPSTMIQETLP